MQQELDINDKKAQNNRVKVAIRIRPFIQRQKILGDNSCMQLVSNTQIILGKQKLFKFDRVFDEVSSQEQIYQQCVHNLVLQCFQGYNAAILAYGQTGSGKTYTMGTSSSRKMSSYQVGILPRVIHNIFSQIQRNGKNYKYNVKATFLQIYNQHIIDLLSDDHTSAKTLKDNNLIAIRQEKDGSVSIYGANQEQVSCQDEMLQLLDLGSYHRTTSTTLMNEASSRSHGIFTITIERNSIDFNHQMGIDQNYVTSKFVFVDLAGSERIKKTGATGATLKEGININLGLLQLGNVISSLAIQKKQAKYINYRNSKLTRILQDSLGGNSNTYMIACVSPAESNYEQSLNTIKYASKAMNIKNKPVINRDPQQAQILKLKGLISGLQRENKELKKQLSQRGIDISKYTQSLQQRAQNLTSFTQSQQLSRIKTRNQILQKKCQKLLIQNKQQTKKSNQLQIQLYENRRARDILELKFQKLLKGQLVTDDDAQYTPIIQSYLNKVQYLQSQIHEKQKSISQLQIQYSKLYESSQRDSKILSKKNDRIFSLQRRIKELEKKLRQTQSQIKLIKQNRQTQNAQISIDGNQYDDRMVIYEDLDQNCIDQLQSQVHLQEDSQFISEISQHESQNQKLSTQIKNIQKTIQDRQAFYNDITEQQIKLEYKLIDQMKQQYHQKIHQLEKQKEKLLLKKQNNRFEQKNNVKIQNLEGELRQLKKKAKEQKQLQKHLSTQSNKLKQLSQQINSFKIQKIQLTRKMKQQKDKFNKFRNKRIKQLFEVKKQNAKKDGQIRKLKNQNKKFAQQALKKKQENNRIKKANETLKQLVKPKKIMRGSMGAIPQIGRLTQRNTISVSLINTKRQGKKQSQALTYSQDQFDSIINTSIKSLLMQIDRQFQVQKISAKCEQIDKQIQQIQAQKSALILKKQRLQIKNQTKSVLGQQIYTYKDVQRQEEDRILLEQYTVKINEIQERLANLDQDLQYKSQRYSNLLIQSQKNYFSYETQIIYNKKYQSIECFRYICISLYRSIIRLLTQNLNLKQHTQSLSCQNNILNQEVTKLKQQVFKLNQQHNQKIEQMRQEYMELKYRLEVQSQNRNTNLGDLDNYSSIGNENNKFYQYNNYEKNQEQMKKKYEKKIDQLNKNNIMMSKQMQTLRRRCQVVTQKYNSLKSMLNKDRFIGITTKDDDNTNNFGPNNNITYNNNGMNNHNFRGERRNQSMAKFQTGVKINPYQSHQEDQGSIQARQRQIKETHDVRKKKNHEFNQILRVSTQLRDLEYNKNNWQLALQISPAHKSPILSLASSDNILVSTASKSIKIWDVLSNQTIHQLQGGVNSSFVRSVVLVPQRQIMFTTNDRNINVWDMRTFKNQIVLKGHKDQIRTLHLNQNKLFSAGKGTINSGSLFGWDLRSDLPFQNIFQREKNQDIFSLTSKDGVLYYGTRDHFVRRMKIQNYQTYFPFQPPHMDTVTGLATLGNYLISGSKDKNLRLWSLQTSMYNLKSTVHAFSQHITYIQNDDYLPLFYASDRSGQIKIFTIRNEKIESVGGILAHSQQINSICKINFNPRRGFFATASSDRSIKCWRPSSQTLEHISADF